MILKASAESDNSELLARFIAQNLKLEADLGKLAQRNAALERNLAKIESERTYEAFDCYLTENWDVSGAITFTGCSGQVHYECQLTPTPRHISSVWGALILISPLFKCESHVK